MIVDACKLLVAALLLTKQHVCRCSRQVLTVTVFGDYNVDPAAAQES